jgi:hypothetical protein
MKWVYVRYRLFEFAYILAGKIDSRVSFIVPLGTKLSVETIMEDRGKCLWARNIERIEMWVW